MSDYRKPASKLLWRLALNTQMELDLDTHLDMYFKQVMLALQSGDKCVLLLLPLGGSGGG